MERSPAQGFLEKHMSEIIENTRTPDMLADHLLGKSAISKEMYNNIRAQKTNQDKMREIYKNLNSKKAFDCAYEWLKKNEHDLIEELENKSNKENFPPERKRPRSQTDKAMDETDGVSTKNVIIPDLKESNTFAKLEEWVSDRKNNQHVIDKLKKKLAKGEMEALEKQLKDKKLKKCLCFTANDVTKINSDRSLKSYLEATKDAKFPVKITLGMLFEKNRGYASPTNDSLLEDNSGSYIDDDESTDVYENDLSSSGYRSSFSTSLNIDQSQNNDQFLFDTEKKSSESPSKNVPDNETKASQVIQGETNSHFDTASLNTAPPLNNVAAGAPVQNVGFQDSYKSGNCPLTKVVETDEPPQIPAVKHADALAYNQGQNERFIKKQPEINDDMPLDKSTDKQESSENHCRIPVGDLCQKEPFDQLDKTSDIGSAPREEAMDIEVGLDETTMHFDTATLNSEQFSSSTSVSVADAPAQSLGLQHKHKSENLPLTKVATTDESPHTSVPRNGGVLLSNFRQNKPFIQKQVKNIDDTPLHKFIGTQESTESHCFTSFEKTDMAPQRSNLKKQTNSLDREICQNEPTVPLRKRHFDTETLNAGLFPSTTPIVVADAPVQNWGLKDVHKSKNFPLTTGPKLDGPPQTPAVKHTDVLVYNLGQNEPSIQQQPEIQPDDMPLDISTDKLESAENHCFSQFEKTRPLNKTSRNDAAPTEEAMDTEISLDETNMHFYTETLNTEQFPSNTLAVVAGAPVQSLGIQDKHRSQNYPLTKVAATEESSCSVPKHSDVLRGNLGQNKPFIQSQAESNDDTPLTKTMEEEKVCEPNKSTSVVMKGQPEGQVTICSEPGLFLPFLSGQEQRSFSSTPLNGSKQRKDDRKKLLTQNKLKKKKDKDSMFKNWAMEKCSGNSEGGLKKEYFSIINIVEHKYRFFIAEKVWVYENPEKDERQIIVFSNEKKISSRTKILAHYQMFVCGIVNAVILGQEKEEIGLDISKVPEPIDRCLKFLSEAFVPALAVFKNMQRTNELDPLL